MSILNEIGKKHGTDKSSDTHGYCDKYEKYLPFKRDDTLKILEIGVAEGNSLRMWKEYFYNSHILGIDINQYSYRYEEDRISIQIGSQNDEKFLMEIAKDYGQFDLIIDDGSHINTDVIFSFMKLFESLKTNGVYIIEDVCTSYWNNYGGGFENRDSTINFFKKSIDYVNFLGEYNIMTDNYCSRNDEQLFEQMKREGLDDIVGTRIESINFLNSLIIITKR